MLCVARTLCTAAQEVLLLTFLRTYLTHTVRNLCPADALHPTFKCKQGTEKLRLTLLHPMCRDRETLVVSKSVLSYVAYCTNGLSC